MLRKFALSAVFAVSASGAFAATELLINGGFETGDFTGWTNDVFLGSDGTIEVTNNDIAPMSGYTVTNPAEGLFHAVTGQVGPGAYALAQAFSVPTGLSSLDLMFDMFAVSAAPLVDGGLDPFLPVTQHARVDIMAIGSDPFDTGADVIHSILVPFISSDFANTAYSAYSFDILPFVRAGRSYTLRFAQADNQNFFSMGVDDVSLVANQVPLPGGLVLLLGGLSAMAVARRKT